MTKASGTFTDLESTSPAYWSVRRFPGMVALGLSVETNGDIDIAFDPVTAREVATALLVALSDEE